MMLALALSVLAAATAPGTWPPGPAAIVVAPETIDVTTFFDGTELHVSGSAPEGLKLAVLMTGPSSQLDLKRKGRVWGLLWMNVGEVRFDDVPSAYLLATSDPVCDLAPFDVRRRHDIGLDVLGPSSQDAAADESRRLFGELVKLKQRERLYATLEGSLETRDDGEGEVAFSTVLEVPARIPEAIYGIALWGFRGDRAEVIAETQLRVEEVGVTHDIAALARNHGTLYGVIALLIAVVVGLGTGLVFGLAAKGGH